MLRKHGAGTKIADLAQNHATSEATLYNWKAKHQKLDCHH